MLSDKDISKILEYKEVINDYKIQAIDAQMYEYAANLRDIEITYFNSFDDFDYISLMDIEYLIDKYEERIEVRVLLRDKRINLLLEDIDIDSSESVLDHLKYGILSSTKERKSRMGMNKNRL